MAKTNLILADQSWIVPSIGEDEVVIIRKRRHTKLAA